MNILAALSGKKTHAVAITIIAVVAIEKLLGIDVPGIRVGENWLPMVLNGLGLSTLRSGVAKAARQR